MENLGDILQRVRLEQGHDIAEISTTLAIPVSILEALESGCHDRLPAPCFSQGFIQTYGEFLGLDATRLTLLHKQEIQDHARHDTPKRERSPDSGTAPRLSLPFQHFVHSELISWAAIVVVLLVAWFGYASFVGKNDETLTTGVEASTVDLRLENMKTAPRTGYRTNVDPAAIDAP